MVSLAILGMGRWGTHLLRNFLALPEVHVVAIADPHPARLAAAAARFQLPPERLLQDWRQAFQLPTVEAVAIATPASTHYSLTQAALQQGYHVLVEKPLALSVAEAVALWQQAQRQQRQLVVDHTYLFHPAVAAGAQVVRSGQLGQLRYAYATRTHPEPVRLDVDVLWDLAIHDIGILNCWLNSMPVQVQASSTAWGDRSHSQADLVWAQLHYPSGLEAVIHLCWLNPDKQRRLGLVGDRGTLVLDELAPQPLVICRADLGTEPIAVEQMEPLRQVCRHFIDCVQGDRQSDRSSGAQGVALVQLLAALSDSMAQQGAPVKVVPPGSD